MIRLIHMCDMTHSYVWRDTPVVRLATASHCNALQRTAMHCNTLQHTATHNSTLQHTATCCNTLKHAATHGNTLQHDTPVIRIAYAHNQVCTHLAATHSYVCHDSFICVTYLIHKSEMTHSYVWHDTPVVRFPYAYKQVCTHLDISRSNMWHDSFIYATTHSYVWHDSSIFVTCNTPIRPSLGVYKLAVTHSYVWHDSFICVTWNTSRQISIRSQPGGYTPTHFSHKCVTWLIHMCGMINHTWLIHLWHMTHSSVTYTSDMTYSFSCVTWWMSHETREWQFPLNMLHPRNPWNRETQISRYLAVQIQIEILA